LICTHPRRNSGSAPSRPGLAFEAPRDCRENCAAHGDRRTKDALFSGLGPSGGLDTVREVVLLIGTFGRGFSWVYRGNGSWDLGGTRILGLGRRDAVPGADLLGELCILDSDSLRW
jgi:hypothetical protein